MNDERYSIEKLKVEINLLTPKAKINFVNAKLSFYLEWQSKEGKDYTPQFFQYDFFEQAQALLNDIKNDISFVYDRDLNWYFNASNAPNQKAVFETSDFIENNRKNIFDPLYFFNLLFRQLDELQDNIDKPIDYIVSLKKMPLTSIQLHTLLCMLLYWHGGYPVKNLNPKFNTILLLIERHFLTMFPNEITLEKEFCKIDKEFSTQLKDLENKFNNNPVFLSDGKFQEIEFDFEDLPSWIISKGIQKRYSQIVFKNENDYNLWINDLKQFIETVPDALKIKTVQKGIEYGEMIYNFHLQKECSNPTHCPYDQSWIRRITLAKTLLPEVKPLPIQKLITMKSKLDFTKDKLKGTLLEIAKVNGYEKPSTYLDELLFDIRQFNSFEFECDFFLNIHHLCKENASSFWSEGHRKDISTWLQKAPIIATKTIKNKELPDGSFDLIDIPLFSTTWDDSPLPAQMKETENVEKNGNSIEEYLLPLKQAFNNDADYTKAVKIINDFFSSQPINIDSPLFVKNGNVKKLAFALGEIWRTQKNEVITYEYLQFYKKSFSIFKPHNLDRSNVFSNSLYKYSISKT